MIVLNEANRIKQHLADKLGIELPKGGSFNPNNTELNDRKKFMKIRQDEDQVNTGVRRLTEPYNPKKNYAWHLGKEYADRHNFPISLTPDKEDLHRRINDRIKGALHLDKEAMMDEYKDKLTHKYGKSPSQPTPEVEAPKSTSKPLIINGKKVQKRSLGVGKVKKQPTPTPEVEAPTSTNKPLIINGRKVQNRSLGVGRKKQVPTPEVEAPKDTSTPPKIETPTSTNKPIMINCRKVKRQSLGTGRKKQVPNNTNNKSFMSRHGGKVALGIGATAAAAYGIHRYRKNKKKKEEEARRQAEEAQKKTGIKRFLK